MAVCLICQETLDGAEHTFACRTCGRQFHSVCFARLKATTVFPPCPNCRAEWTRYDNQRLCALLAASGTSARRIAAATRREIQELETRARSSGRVPDCPPPPPLFISPCCCMRVDAIDAARGVFVRVAEDTRTEWAPHMERTDDGFIYKRCWICPSCSQSLTEDSPLLQLPHSRDMPFCADCRITRMVVINLNTGVRFWACGERPRAQVPYVTDICPITYLDPPSDIDQLRYMGVHEEGVQHSQGSDSVIAVDDSPMEAPLGSFLALLNIEPQPDRQPDDTQTEPDTFSEPEPAPPTEPEPAPPTEPAEPSAQPAADGMDPVMGRGLVGVPHRGAARTIQGGAPQPQRRPRDEDAEQRLSPQRRALRRARVFSPTSLPPTSSSSSSSGLPREWAGMPMRGSVANDGSWARAAESDDDAPLSALVREPHLSRRYALGLRTTRTSRRSFRFRKETVKITAL